MTASAGLDIGGQSETTLPRYTLVQAQGTIVARLSEKSRWSSVLLRPVNRPEREVSKATFA